MSFAPSYVNGDYLHDVLTGTATPSWTANTYRGALFTGNISGQDANVTERYGVGAYASNECPDSGDYAAGGATLTTPTLFAPSAGKILFRDAGASSLVWTGVTFSGANEARGIVVYNDSITTPNANAVVCAINFGVDVPVTAGNMTVIWNTTYGLFYFQYA